MVALDRVALRTTAWVELHAWLAAAGREPGESGDPALDAAAHEYAGALADDDRDERLGRTASALGQCDDEKCARAAVTGTRFAAPYVAALPRFLERRWMDHAAKTRGGIEVARAAMGPEVEGIVVKLAEALAIDWPSPPPIVDVVTEAPEPGRDAPIRVLLGARGSCFKVDRTETDSMRNARIVDCVLTYAALPLAPRSPLASALGRELAARGKAGETARAWSALVVHAVAMTVTAWEPRHASVLRRSAAAIMPAAMAWLAKEWPARLRGEPASDFGARYAAALAANGAVTR